MRMTQFFKKPLLRGICLAAAITGAAAVWTASHLRAEVSSVPVPTGEWPMWGLTPHRDMVSPEKNPPTDWEVETGKNILWSQTLGSKTYGNPVVSQGFVFVGTNNEGHRDPSNTVDAGVLMCFDSNTGKYLWQKVYPKLPTGRVNDWPGEGLCATVYTEPGRVWYCSNRCEVHCLDLSPGADKLPEDFRGA